jgi:hypothetical protein
MGLACGPESDFGVLPEDRICVQAFVARLTRAGSDLQAVDQQIRLPAINAQM